MWIFLSDSFLSIVRYDSNVSMLLVRGRAKHDIERIFPGANVQETPSADYRFRAVLTREEVAKAISQRIMDISYGNFKDSVHEHVRHDAYMKCWSVMARLQEEVRRK
jgi:hypothetical protein